MPDNVNPYEPPATEGSQEETSAKTDVDGNPNDNKMTILLGVIVLCVLFGLIMGIA